MYMRAFVCCLYVCMSTTCVSADHGGQKRVLNLLGSETVSDSCEELCGSWELNSERAVSTRKHWVMALALICTYFWEQVSCIPRLVLNLLYIGGWPCVPDSYALCPEPWNYRYTALCLVSAVWMEKELRPSLYNCAAPSALFLSYLSIYFDFFSRLGFFNSGCPWSCYVGQASLKSTCLWFPNAGIKGFVLIPIF